MLEPVNPRKAVRPNGVSAGWYVLPAFFNQSLSQTAVPPCLKFSTIYGLNDYWPVALMPAIMKRFVKLICIHITYPTWQAGDQSENTTLHLSLDQGLPDRLFPEGECNPPHLLGIQPQHWLSTEPTTLLSLHTGLHSYTPQQPHHLFYG